jgi:flagellar biosynthetic protein FliP
MKKRLFLLSLVSLLTCLPLSAQDATGVTINLGATGQLSTSMRIAFIFTLIALTPAILMLMTSFTRLIISFHFLKQAMGLQGVPPNQVLVGLSLFLTLFIMMPVGTQIYEEAVVPFNKGEITEMEALSRSSGPLQEFMLRQTREADLALFYSLSNTPLPQNRRDVKMLVLIPAFILSELKTSFQIGFLLYVPFLIVDIVIASILVSLGMIFLPPVMVSMPFKIVLFILADGWTLLVTSLLRSFA